MGCRGNDPRIAVILAEIASVNEFAQKNPLVIAETIPPITACRWRCSTQWSAVASMDSSPSTSTRRCGCSASLITG